MDVPYALKVRKHVDKLFAKMGKKDMHNLKIIYKKLEEVCKDPESFKPLNAPMQNLKKSARIEKFRDNLFDR